MGHLRVGEILFDLIQVTMGGTHITQDVRIAWNIQTIESTRARL